jgi:hypothetical protein
MDDMFKRWAAVTRLLEDERICLRTMRAGLARDNDVAKTMRSLLTRIGSLHKETD